jgi:hypothetical protein
VEARGPGRGPYTKTTVISGKWEDLRTEVMRVWGPRKEAGDHGEGYYSGSRKGYAHGSRVEAPKSMPEQSLGPSWPKVGVNSP